MVNTGLIRIQNPASDHHVHTKLCGHATGEMEQYVQTAIEKKLKKINFLEHMEEEISWKTRIWLQESDFDKYFAEGIRLRSIYKGQIEIGLGVECGYNPDATETLLKRLAQRQWDEIGISCHFLKIEGLNEHLNLFTRNEENIAICRSIGTDSLLTSYFHNLTEAVQILPGTIVCHLDGPLRHLPELQLRDSHYMQIDSLLQEIAKKNITLEINTSGLRIRGEQFPARRILAMAQGYDITMHLGSDAHKPEDVGSNFQQFWPSTL